MQRATFICVLLAWIAAAPLYGAQPVTITFEDIHNKPFGHDLLPPFLVFTTGFFFDPSGNDKAPLGVTMVGNNFNDCWLAITRIGSQTRVAEATAHELAHQWWVNHGGSNPKADGGHCGRLGEPVEIALTAASSTKLCVMTEDVFDGPEANDGFVGFHYRKFGGTPDSEYLHIRRRAEPVPQQNEYNRETPQ